MASRRVAGSSRVASRTKSLSALLGILVPCSGWDDMVQEHRGDYQHAPRRAMTCSQSAYSASEGVLRLNSSWGGAQYKTREMQCVLVSQAVAGTGACVNINSMVKYKGTRTRQRL